MNRQLAEKVADAVLYEGYMLYPYRPSAIKNRQRWSFGILYPPAYEEVPRGTERSTMRTECLLIANERAGIHVQLRFLQLVSHQFGTLQDQRVTGDSNSLDNWQQGVPRSVEFDHADLHGSKLTLDFDFPAEHHSDSLLYTQTKPQPETELPQQRITGTVTCSAERLRDNAVKLTVEVSNNSSLASNPADRDQALLRSLLSAHLILTATNAEFISLLEPPETFKDLLSTCSNIGNFPVLVGEPGQRDMLLCSPIVLYDYPQVAPESAGDFYDATEMDEMLTLRVMTLTDGEKREMASADDRLRALLQRTEETARQQLIKTHGVIRKPAAGERS